jgi:acyl-CoA thioesterase FadM
MMFYSNYPVIVERVLGAQGGTGFLSSLSEMKLKIPARLGDLLQIKCEPDRVICSNQLGEDVFIAKQATLGQRRCNEVSGKKIEKLSLVQYVSRYDLWPDEIISDNQFLPTRTIFNLFERARTDVLGGPGQLAGAALAKNHVYVARIKDFRASLSSYPTSAQVLVVSQTHGMGDSIVEFVQQIICPETETVFSSVKVTCVSVDSETKKPTPFSSDLRERLGIL